MKYQKCLMQEQLVSNAYKMINTDGLQSITLGAPTSAGKSKMNAELIKKQLKKTEFKTAVVVAPGWRILREGLKAIETVLGDEFELLRFGGDTEELRGLEQVKNANSITGEGQIIFTTIGTAMHENNRYRFYKIMDECEIAVFDEPHMVSKGHQMKKLRSKLERAGVPLVESTATPADNCPPLVPGAPALDDMVSLGRICPYKIISQPTGIRFELDISNNRITEKSFTLLSEDKGRNKKLIKEISKHIKKIDFNRGFIVACNIKHCSTLKKLIAKEIPNIKCKIYNSSMSSGEQREVLEEFRTGTIDLLIGVRSVFTGVSVDEANYLFNSRPMGSKGDFLQSLGRIVRFMSKKEAYYIDFCDNIEKHSHLIYKPVSPYKTSNGRFGAPSLVRYPVQNFKLEQGLGCVNYFSPDGFKAPLGIQNKIPFGFEAEFTLKNPQKALDVHGDKDKYSLLVNGIKKELGKSSIKNVIAYPHGEHDPAINYKRNHSIVYDGSCVGEFVSKILVGKNGLIELEKILDSLDMIRNKFDLHHNYETGLHLHVGTMISEVELQTFLLNIRVIEPYLALLVPPSRVCRILGDNEYSKSEENQYCMSWRKNLSKADIKRVHSFSDLESLLDSKDLDSKYFTFNLNGLIYSEGPQTVECRMHGGSFDKRKVLPWVSLMSQLMENLKSEFTFTNRKITNRNLIPTTKRLSEFTEIMNEALNYQARPMVKQLYRRAEVILKKYQTIEMV